MQKFSVEFYHKNTISSKPTIKVNDIVRVENHHYIIDSINNNALLGTDMYGNSKKFFIDDIQKVIFDSSSQSSISFENIKNTQLLNLQNELKRINNKLLSSSIPLSKVKNLKLYKKNILEQIQLLN